MGGCTSPCQGRMTCKAWSFKKMVAEAGGLDVMGRIYPRMQILSVPEIFEGKRFDTPGAVGRGDPHQALPLPTTP